MRTLTLIACSIAVTAALVGVAGAAPPDAGVLSVERGRGVVTLDLRGSVLGRLGNGSLRVTDLTPRDKYAPIVVGRKLVLERVGPRTAVYRGAGLRFRMLGGAYRIVVRGSGISLSAVGRGIVTLDAERTLFEPDAGLYSLDGVDCEIEPQLCTALPDEPERFILGTTEGPRTMLP